MVYYEIFHAKVGKDGINRGLWIEILLPLDCMMNLNNQHVYRFLLFRP